MTRSRAVVGRSVGRRTTTGGTAPATASTARRPGDEHRDADDVSATQLARIQRLYDSALERSAAVSDRPLQRYLTVLIANPRSA